MWLLIIIKFKLHTYISNVNIGYCTTNIVSIKYKQMCYRLVKLIFHFFLHFWCRFCHFFTANIRKWKDPFKMLNVQVTWYVDTKQIGTYQALHLSKSVISFSSKLWPNNHYDRSFQVLSRKYEVFSQFWNMSNAIQYCDKSHFTLTNGKLQYVFLLI